MDSLRTYDAVSRDVVGRWAYPMTPDANALPRGERSTYAHAFANAYREKNVHVAASATVALLAVCAAHGHCVTPVVTVRVGWYCCHS